jgi:hypothetical protein
VFPDIALTGKARAGKDTVAAHLVTEHGYKRVAFADPLKEMALQVDPIIHFWTSFCDECDHDTEFARLSEIVDAIGWESAKDRHPEVRRFLQQLGQSVRQRDPQFWIRLAEAAILDTDGDQPIVVTDVRYENEYLDLIEQGFTTIRITRAGLPADTHVSETDMDRFVVDHCIENNGTIADLHRAVERVLT